MSVISKETFEKFTKEEKDWVIKEYNSDAGEGHSMLEKLFGKENLIPIPKIWNDILKYYPARGTGIVGLECELKNVVGIDDKVAQKIIATAKLAKLIEMGYEGVVTDDEYISNEYSLDDSFWCIWVNARGKIECTEIENIRDLLIFHTREHAEEFMSYPENVKLVKQYFMI